MRLFLEATLALYLIMLCPWWLACPVYRGSVARISTWAHNPQTSHVLRVHGRLGLSRHGAQGFRPWSARAAHDKATRGGGPGSPLRL